MKISRIKNPLLRLVVIALFIPIAIALLLAAFVVQVVVNSGKVLVATAIECLDEARGLASDIRELLISTYDEILDVWTGEVIEISSRDERAGKAGGRDA